MEGWKSITIVILYGETETKKDKREAAIKNMCIAIFFAYESNPGLYNIQTKTED